MNSKFVFTLCLLLNSTLFLSCKKVEVIQPEETTLISGQTFNETVLIDGHTYDNLIIENCIFENIEGDGLQIRDVDNLIIRNCIFRDINGNAIRFRTSGSSDSVTIENNDIYNIAGNGILSYETHSNTTIKENHIYNVGTDLSGSAAGHPHHGIYFQGPNFLIHKNNIHDIINSNGNCISVRSYGTISSNELRNSTKHGISYYSDHPGLNGQLLIENNFIYDNLSRGVNLQTDGNSGNHVGSAIIRFNSIITSDISCIGVSSGMSDVVVEADGNILIRTDGTASYVYSSDPVSQTQNLESSVDIGFVNYNLRDLHITPSSAAVDYATGVTNFPLFDIDGENRNPGNLDAGADENY